MVNKTLEQLYLDARKALSLREDEQIAASYARQLVFHLSGISPAQFLAQRDAVADDRVCAQMDMAVYRLMQGEPIAYVLGQWDFYGMTLEVTPDVLIPRDDTCAVTELAIKKGVFLDTSPRILDLCTGSGCIGLAIAHRVKDARITLGDISDEALAVAKRNIKNQKLAGRVSCMKVNALDTPPAFLGKFDMIVSNPPYITACEMEELPHSVKDYEPKLALFGGEDGLDFYRSIAKNYAVALKPGGYLCFEFGMGQGDDVCRILEENGYTILERTRDYNDRERAVLAQRQ
ncbi:MAG: peptide chain release factor N(5)-glutamine methyltransferase [Oscillospiraceae bacterium]|nr:peptide chain release factor N(5)-glutamine methyltransferase [Oscillospiraceae bacterium]